MSTAAFLAALQAAIPDAPAAGADLHGLAAFGFVTDVVAPPYLAALRAVAAGKPGAGEQLDALAGAIEVGLGTGDDDLVDALAMRLFERHVLRDPALLAAALPGFGPATTRVVEKLGALIEETERRVARATSGR